MTDDDAIYVIAIRSKGPKNGQEVVAALESIRDLVEPVTAPHAAAHRAGDCTAAMHDALLTLGFDFDTANRIFPVVGRAGPQLHAVADERTDPDGT